MQEKAKAAADQAAAAAAVAPAASAPAPAAAAAKPDAAAFAPAAAASPAAVGAKAAAAAGAGGHSAADIAKAWKQFTAPDGRPYYHNKLTKQSKWVMPEEMKQAQAAGGSSEPAAAATAAAAAGGSSSAKPPPTQVVPLSANGVEGGKVRGDRGVGVVWGHAGWLLRLLAAWLLAGWLASSLAHWLLAGWLARHQWLQMETGELLDVCRVTGMAPPDFAADSMHAVFCVCWFRRLPRSLQLPLGSRPSLWCTPTRRLPRRPSSSCCR